MAEDFFAEQISIKFANTTQLSKTLDTSGSSLHCGTFPTFVQCFSALKKLISSVFIFCESLNTHLIEPISKQDLLPKDDYEKLFSPSLRLLEVLRDIHKHLLQSTCEKLSSETENFFSFFAKHRDFFLVYDVFIQSFNEVTCRFKELALKNGALFSFFHNSFREIKAVPNNILALKAETFDDFMFIPILNIFPLTNLVEKQRKLLKSTVSLTSSIQEVNGFLTRTHISTPQITVKTQKVTQNDFTQLLYRACSSLRSNFMQLIQQQLNVVIPNNTLERVSAAILYTHPSDSHLYCVGEKVILFLFTNSIVICRFLYPSRLVVIGQFSFENLAFFTLSDYSVRYPTPPSQKTIRLHFKMTTESIMETIKLIAAGQPAKFANYDQTFLISFFSRKTFSEWCQLLSSKFSAYVLKNMGIALDGSNGDKAVVKSFFNVPLGVVMSEQKEIFPDLKIPFLLHIIFRNILTRGLGEEGIARLAGNSKTIDELINTIGQAQMITFAKYSTHDLFSIVKRFFDQLPEPLLTKKLFQNWVDLEDIKDEKLKINKAKELLMQLPKVNYEVLREYLFVVFQISLSSVFNKMSLSNLSIVTASGLLKNKSIQVQEVEDLTIMSRQSDVGLFLVSNYEVLFPESFLPRPSTNTDITLFNSLVFRKKIITNLSEIKHMTIFEKQLFTLDTGGMLTCLSLVPISFQYFSILKECKSMELIGFFIYKLIIFVVTSSSLFLYSLDKLNRISDLNNIQNSTSADYKLTHSISAFFFDENAQKLYLGCTHKILYFDFRSKTTTSTTNTELTDSKRTKSSAINSQSKEIDYIPPPSLPQDEIIIPPPTIQNSPLLSIPPPAVSSSFISRSSSSLSSGGSFTPPYKPCPNTSGTPNSSLATSSLPYALNSPSTSPRTSASVGIGVGLIGKEGGNPLSVSQSLPPVKFLPPPSFQSFKLSIAEATNVLKNGTVIFRFPSDEDQTISSMAFFQNTMWIGTNSGMVMLIEDHNIVCSHIPHTDRVACFGKVDETIWSCSLDSTICIFDMNGVLLSQLFGHRGIINCMVTFSNNIISFGEESHLWKDNGSYCFSFSGLNTGNITCARAFFVDKDGYHIFTGSDDHSVVEWVFAFTPAKPGVASKLTALDITPILSKSLFVLSSDFGAESLQFESKLKTVQPLTIPPNKTSKTHRNHRREKSTTHLSSRKSKTNSVTSVQRTFGTEQFAAALASATAKKSKE